MFDVLATMGVAALGEIIKQTVSGAVNWAKGRKKPAPAVVNEKVEQIVADATKKVLPDALSSEDRSRIVSGLVDIVRPTLDEVMQYSPNTERIVSAARSVGVRRTPVKKSAAKKVAMKKHSPKFPSKKKTSVKKAPPKRAR